MLFAWHGSTAYGPVPTGCGSSNFTGSFWEPQTCLETIGVSPAMYQKYGVAGALNCMLTVFPLAVTLSRIEVHSALKSRPGLSFIRLKVKATSSAVIGLPSFHFTPSRIVNVIDFLSGAHW